MKNRIINIVIFVVAILACCLAIAFSFWVHLDKRST